MKKLNKNIELETNNILQSGYKSERVNTTAFFATRVIGKVEQLEDNVVWFPRLSLVLRPVLVLVLIVNVFNFFIYNQPVGSDTATEASIELVVNDYGAWNNDFILSDDLVFNN